MDWGFVNVEAGAGDSYKVARFAMICHHCGERYIEFFPNAKRENLFIGMIHAFNRMGSSRRNLILICTIYILTAVLLVGSKYLSCVNDLYGECLGWE